MRDVLLEMGVEEKADSLDVEEVARGCRSDRGVGKISYQLLEISQRRNY